MASEPPEPEPGCQRGDSLGTLEAVGRCGSCFLQPLLPESSRRLGWPPGLTKLENSPLEKQREGWGGGRGEGPMGQGDLGPAAHRHTLSPVGS